MNNKIRLFVKLSFFLFGFMPGVLFGKSVEEDPSENSDSLRFLQLPPIEKFIVAEYTPVLGNWLDYYGLKLSDFRLESTSDIDFTTDKDELSQFYKSDDMSLCTKPNLQFADYSPDHTRYIDIFSRSIFEEDTNGKWQYLGSDDCQEIRYIDCTKKINKMLSFRGMSSISDAVFWKNNDVFCVVSFELNDRFHICIYDIPGNKEFDLLLYVGENHPKYSDSYFTHNLELRGFTVD